MSILEASPGLQGGSLRGWAQAPMSLLSHSDRLAWGTRMCSCYSLSSDPDIQKTDWQGELSHSGLLSHPKHAPKEKKETQLHFSSQFFC